MTESSEWRGVHRQPNRETTTCSCACRLGVCHGNGCVAV